MSATLQLGQEHDAHRIARKLWVGSYPRPDAGMYFDAVVLCARELQEHRLRCAVLHAPFSDTPAPTLGDVAVAVEAARQVQSARAEGKRVLVTCAAGRNRSALVATLALVLDGYAPDRAIARVRERRLCPDGVMALSNEAFVKVVHRVGRHLAGR